LPSHTKKSHPVEPKAARRLESPSGLTLAIPAPWIVRGQARAAARLFALVGFALLIFPLLTKGYDFRFVVPPLGPLSVAAALSGWALWSRFRPD
jgi:hypothetical protein